MLLRLQAYTLKVEYKKGKEMYVADTLSRAYLPLESSVESSVRRLEYEQVNFTESLNVSEPRLRQIQTHTTQDTCLQTLKSVILSGWPDTKEEVPVTIREYWNFRDELAVHNRILFKESRVVIPKLLRKEMLTRIHSSHQGIVSSLSKARGVIFWPNMGNEIRDHIQQCGTCCEYDIRQQKEPLITHDIPDHPWGKVGVDLFTLQKTDYLVSVDYYSDFWEIDTLSDTTAATVIACLKRHFSRHGIPDIVMSDNGPQFSSAEFAEFAREWEFSHTTSSPYHSQSNGKVESAVKISKTILKKTIRNGQDPWKAILDWRNTPTAGMDSSPS
ncbi:uncharacterized protein K02A2.6-like [Pecten maximus]|uniref:uncharacterized protein K02A2.6-like n=1 Tax=Pecten maximus TaxID=6579 RepID=UPI001458F991|nr:uncharacterized protein K02A2.6-like [Pecten maximus]